MHAHASPNWLNNARGLAIFWRQLTYPCAKYNDCSFKLVIDKFKERAEIAGWTVEHQLYQLKIHLDQTASDVFRMILASEWHTFDEAVATLGKCFNPKNIEELYVIKFYYLIQPNECIKQLGISVQCLDNIPSQPLLSDSVCNLSSPLWPNISNTLVMSTNGGWSDSQEIVYMQHITRNVSKETQTPQQLILSTNLWSKSFVSQTAHISESCPT